MATRDTAGSDHGAGAAVQLEANVDDLDPRLWPHVLDRLLEAGAQDAWVTPILMKKGRPAFTLGVLCDEAAVDRVRATVFAETSTIGMRELSVRKHVLERGHASVDVEGQPVDVKTARDADGHVVNRSVEWDDVVAAAQELGLSAKQVLAAATAAAHAEQP